MIEVPVLIVGGGPAGLNLAINLAWHRTPCMLVNEPATTPNHPQGNTHNARTMEHYRRLGLAERIRDEGLPPDHCHDAVFVTRITGFELGRIRLPTSTERRRPWSADLSLGPEPLHRCSQMFVERVLKQHADGLDPADVRFGWRMNEFSQAADHVTVEIEEVATGRVETVRCFYLVGCDGGQSSVRRALGVSYEGESGEEIDFMVGRMLSTHFHAPALYDLMKTSPPWQFHAMNHDGRASIVALDGKGHFLNWAKLRPDLDPDRIDPRQPIFAAAGREFPIEILSSKPWQAGLSLVAERYQDRRVLMAGDAVHLFTPTGGFGMNTGVDDVVNLAWKLAACHHGWAGPGLIDSYEAERRPAGIRNLAQSYSLAKGKATIGVPPDIEDDTPDAARTRETLGRRMVEVLREEYASIGVQLGARYDNSPLIADDGTAPPADRASVYTPTACPGGRAPHFWLTDGSALFDHFGRGFTLLRLGVDAPETDALAAAAAARGVPLKVLEITDLSVRDIYETDLALIRPDQYVAWRGNAMPEDPAALIDQVTGGSQ